MAVHAFVLFVLLNTAASLDIRVVYNASDLVHELVRVHVLNKVPWYSFERELVYCSIIPNLRSIWNTESSN